MVLYSVNRVAESSGHGWPLPCLPESKHGAVNSIIDAPVDVPTVTACSNDCLRMASKVGSPICIQRPSMSRSLISQRPTKTATTLGWNRWRSPAHSAGHCWDAGEVELHGPSIGSGTPWLMYSVLRTTPQPMRAPLSRLTP